MPPHHEGAAADVEMLVNRRWRFAEQKLVR